MAITDLALKFNVCIKENCGKIVISDTTGNYNVDSNPGGWGTSNPDANDIVEASITCIFPSGAIEVFPIQDVLHAQSETALPFELLVFENEELDGIYEYTYTVSDGEEETSFTITKFSLCNVRCCIDKLWAKAALGLTIQDCNCGGKTELYCQKATQAEALYKAIIAAASSGKDLVRNELLKKLQRICSLENCNCN